MRWGALLPVVLVVGMAVPVHAKERESAELDVLVISAHPDNEAYSLALIGQMGRTISSGRVPTGILNWPA